MQASRFQVPDDLPRQVAAALHEDVGSGDVTASLVPATTSVRGEVVSREAAIICGAPWVHETFRQLDPQITLEWCIGEGDTARVGATLLRVAGPARGVLTGERTALNFLQLVSGTATAVQRFVAAVAGTGCEILDTRKTLPGLRSAQKYAVRCGGAQNHSGIRL
jgi:nicotinate-nucleotide pyrophosphorylase (carboxylating)